jgi:hypothetical protein
MSFLNTILQLYGVFINITQELSVFYKFQIKKPLFLKVTLY